MIYKYDNVIKMYTIYYDLKLGFKYFKSNIARVLYDAYLLMVNFVEIMFRDRKYINICKSFWFSYEYSIHHRTDFNKKSFNYSIYLDWT